MNLPLANGQTALAPRGFAVGGSPANADAKMWAGLIAEVAAMVGLSDESCDELRDELQMMAAGPLLPLIAEARERPMVLGIAAAAKWALRWMRERRDNETPAIPPEKDAAPQDGEAAEVSNG